MKSTCITVSIHTIFQCSDAHLLQHVFDSPHIPNGLFVPSTPRLIQQWKVQSTKATSPELTSILPTLLAIEYFRLLPLRPIQINIYIMLGAYFSSIWRIEPSKDVASSNQNNRDFGTKYIYMNICRLNNICIHHISYVRSYPSPAQQQLLHPKFPLCVVCWKSAVRSF